MWIPLDGRALKCKVKKLFGGTQVMQVSTAGDNSVQIQVASVELPETKELPDETTVAEYHEHIEKLNNKITELRKQIKALEREHDGEDRALRAQIRDLTRIVNGFEYICKGFIEDNSDIYIRDNGTRIAIYKNTYGKMPRHNRDILVGTIRELLKPNKDFVKGYDYEHYKPKVDWKRVHGLGW